MNWHTPIRFVPKIGPIIAKRLQKLEIETAGELLFHLPVRYNDYSLISPIGRMQEGEIVTVVGKVIKSENIYVRNRRQIQNLTLEDQTGTINTTWFNQPYLTKNLPVGTTVALAGKVKIFGRKMILEYPEYEIVREMEPLLHTGRLVPIYSETAGISSKFLRSRIDALLKTELVNEYLPKTILEKYAFPSFKEALMQIHFPQKVAQIAPARKRLSFDELFLIQLEGQLHRHLWKTKNTTKPFIIPEDRLQKFKTSLPFTLTLAQKRVVSEIMTDLKNTQPMNRLLQGDVGSGKTVVAALAIYISYLNDSQSLFMAPTEILAEQHFKTLQTILTPLGMKVGILTGSKKSSELSVLSSQFDVVVGTHALIEKKVQLPKIGLVIIDEQHRFGVAQRALLRQKGTTPHVLTMTATPIPRTMALTLHSDLDLSVIDQMPKGRIPTKTWVVPPQKRAAAYTWITKQIIESKHHDGVFIICPFIEPSESLQTIKAATHEFQRLKKEIFKDVRVGLLHGKLKSTEKNHILNEFRDGKFDILVATPVVEVGIDVPRATIILIEAAERFGLAQLHQLRGRVGRGQKISYCLLFTANSESQSISRLKHLEKVINGAELAEIDLKIRGPGSLYGTSQHGRQSLKIASYADFELIQSAKKAVSQLIIVDPTLNQFPALKERLKSGKIINQVTPD